MKDILEQYGELILASVCGIIILGIVAAFLIGSFSGVFDTFLSRNM